MVLGNVQAEGPEDAVGQDPGRGPQAAVPPGIEVDEPGLAGRIRGQDPAVGIGEDLLHRKRQRGRAPHGLAREQLLGREIARAEPRREPARSRDVVERIHVPGPGDLQGLAEAHRGIAHGRAEHVLAARPHGGPRAGHGHGSAIARIGDGRRIPEAVGAARLRGHGARDEAQAGRGGRERPLQCHLVRSLVFTGGLSSMPKRMPSEPPATSRRARLRN